MLTSDQAVERHLAHERLRNLRPGSIYQRNRALVRLRRVLECELLDADGDDLKAWYEGLTLTPESRAHDLSHVRSFFRWAHLEGIIEADPTIRLIRPRLPRRLPRPMADEHVALALADAPDRVRPWLFLAAFAGLRACEIAALRRQDVLDSADPAVIVVTDGKGGKQRVVPLAPLVDDALHAAGMPARGFLFRRRDGQAGPVAPHLVSHYSNDYLHGLGIAHTLHTLRHRFATELYRSTTDLRLVQETLGHSSPVTTAGYAAWSPAKAAEAVNRIAMPKRLATTREEH